MTIGHALQDVSEPGKGFDVVRWRLGSSWLPIGRRRRPSREQMVFAPDRSHPFILPMSGRK